MQEREKIESLLSTGLTLCFQVLRTPPSELGPFLPVKRS